MTDTTQLPLRLMDPLGVDALGGPVRGKQDTSRLAAMDGVARVTKDRRRVLATVVAAGERGATQDEVSAVLLLAHQTASARFWELRTAGFIARSPDRRPTRTGATAAVHYATTAGRAALRQSQQSAGEPAPAQGAA